MPQRELTNRLTQEIGDALIPRFRLAIAPDLDAIRREIATLKAASRRWGALSGAMSSMLAILAALYTRR